MTQLAEPRAFHARTSQEALRLVKKALGEDAVIIKSRSVLLGPSKARRIEILASAPHAEPAYVPTFKAAPQRPDPLREALTFNEVAPEHIDHLLAGAENGKLGPAIESMLPHLGSSIWSKKTRMTFVGPTGVGKTTSIAKLAAQAKSRGLRVGLVTIDTYRVAAVEQLSKYAELLGLPFLTAGSASELRDAMERFQNADIVFVDTAGAGTWDRARLEELNAILDCGVAIEKTLVVPASGNKRDYRNLLEGFSPFGISAICVTKVDETCCFGPCFSSLVEAQLPVSFFGIGPNVPSDMEQATATRIQRLISRKTH